MKTLLFLIGSSALFAQDNSVPAELPRVTRTETLELRNLALEMQILETKYAELVKQRGDVVAAICKRASIEACEIRPDGLIVKRTAPKPEVKQ